MRLIDCWHFIFIDLNKSKMFEGNNFSPVMSDGFFWEFGGTMFFNIPMIYSAFFVFLFSDYTFHFNLYFWHYSVISVVWLFHLVHTFFCFLEAWIFIILIWFPKLVCYSCWPWFPKLVCCSCYAFSLSLYFSATTFEPLMRKFIDVFSSRPHFYPVLPSQW